MSCTVKFRGQTPAVSIENSDGEALGLLLLQLKKPDYVEINGNTVRTSEITGVTKNRMTEADMPRMAEDRQITMGSHCKAEYSIQNEINNIARNDNPKDWAKKITDKKWQESTRLELWKLTDKWCDYKAETCACDGILLQS